MKPFLRHSLLLLIAAAAFAPAKAQLKLGDNPTSINKDAILDLNSDHQGLLFPRVLKAQIIAGGGLFGAVDGLMVYVTDESTLYLKQAGIWTKVGSTSITVNSKSGPTISLSTSDIPEGTNLYYTDARARAAFSAGTGIAISALGVIDNTGVLKFNGRTGNVTPTNGDYNINQMGDVALSGLATGDVLYYNGTKWSNWTPNLAQLGAWSITGNNNITTANFLGTTNNVGLVFKTDNAQRGQILGDGRWDIGGVDITYLPNGGANLMVKSRMIIEGNGPGTNNELIFTKASAGGVMRIADDQADFQIQGGNGLDLALGANKGIVLFGDRGNASFVPTSGNTGTGVSIPSQRDASVPLGISGYSATQVANLTEWRTSTGTVLSSVDKSGQFGIGNAAPARTLHVTGTMRLTGSITGTTATSLMARDVNGDVLAIASPVVAPVNPNPTWSLSGNSLNINNTAAIWNANQIQGSAVPAPSGSNTYLKFDGTNLSWAAAASGSTLPSSVNNSVLVTGTGSPYWAQATSPGVSLLVSTGSNPYWANTTNGGILLASSGGSSIYWSNAPTGAGALVSSNGNPSWAGTTSNGLLMSNGTSAYWGGTSNTAVLTTGNTGTMSWQSAPSGNSILYSNGTSVYWQAANFMNSSLGSAQMWIGNGSGVATAVNMSGDATIDNTGKLSIGSQKITQGMIANSAVGLNQMANGTAGSYLTTNASGVPQWTAGTPMSNALTNGQMWLGNGSNVATGVTMSGDATITNAGVLTVANNAITAAKIANTTITGAKIANTTITATQLANGAVGVTQMANGSNNAIMTTTAAGVPQWTAATANSYLTANASGVPTWTAGTPMSSALNNGQMLVGNASNVATAVTMSGDATINNAGALTVSNNAITAAKIANNTITNAQVANNTITATQIANNTITATQIANNAVGLTQMAAGTANSYLTTNASGTPQWTAGTPMSNALTNGQMWIGNGSNAATAVTMSGDATITNAGVLSLAASAVNTTELANGGVTAAKLNQMSATSGQVLSWNGTAWAPATPAATGVTSVGLVMPSIFTVSNSPVTSTGTLTAALNSQTAKTVLAAPTASNGTPTFRTLVEADLPSLTGYIQNQNAAAQATSNFWISGSGKTGGTMEIGGTSGTTTGLKFTGINSSTTPAASNNVMLTLDASGNVILAKNPATANWLTTGNSSPGAGSFLGTITDDVMNIRSSNLPFLSFGKRAFLGLTQSYPGYQDNNEKVTYIQSALQFQADAASFYKPKMWTDSLGNFHMMGPMAGTDYFEFAAGGTNNAGEFDITSGDDGDEPIVFRNYLYTSNATTEWARVQKGKFGINTPGTEPARTLHVNGDMRLVNDASTTNTKLLGKDGNGDVNSVTVNGTSTATATTPLSYTSNTLIANNTAPLWNANQLLSKAISTTAPTNGQVLVYNSTTQTWVPGTAAGGVTTLGTSSATATAAASIASTTLTINNTAPQWNANKLQGQPVDATAPATGNVMQYDGTQWTAGPQMYHFSAQTDATTGNISYTNSATTTVDISGDMPVNLAVGATIMVNFRTALPTGIVMAYVIRNGNASLKIGFTNAGTTTGAVAKNTVVDITVIQ